MLIELAKKHNLHLMIAGVNVMVLGQEKVERKNLFLIKKADVETRNRYGQNFGTI